MLSEFNAWKLCLRVKLNLVFLFFKVNAHHHHHEKDNHLSNKKEKAASKSEPPSEADPVPPSDPAPAPPTDPPTSVSYTHLDVYKRQVQDVEDDFRRLEDRGVWRGGQGSSWAMNE